MAMGLLQIAMVLLQTMITNAGLLPILLPELGEVARNDIARTLRGLEETRRMRRAWCVNGEVLREMRHRYHAIGYCKDDRDVYSLRKRFETAVRLSDRALSGPVRNCGLALYAPGKHSAYEILTQNDVEHQRGHCRQ